MTDDEARRMLDRLGPLARRALLAFPPGASWPSDGAGWWRDWAEIVELCEPGASHRNCLRPLGRIGAAEQMTARLGFACGYLPNLWRLTPIGLELRRRAALLPPAALQPKRPSKRR